MHEFEFVAKQISAGVKDNSDTFENILLGRLGSFISNKKHINKLKQINEKREEDKDCL